MRLTEDGCCSCRVRHAWSVPSQPAMDCPDWVTPDMRLALRAQPRHAGDAVDDLVAITRGWDDRQRAWLVARVSCLALRGTALPAALMIALAEVVDDRDDAAG